MICTTTQPVADVRHLHPLYALLKLCLSPHSTDELTLHDLHSLLQLVCADCPQRVGKSAFKAAMPLSTLGQLPRLPLEAMWLSLEVTFLYEKVRAAGAGLSRQLLVALLGLL